jgi:flagellar hook-associated protein 3 FlgL
MMMANTMLLNIGRNMKYVDNLYEQISTAKKIQVPSDDPITAARALKFRSSVSDTTQYQRNASQGMAWMDVTESAYTNVVNIMKSIKDRCVQAANGTLEAVDRQAIAAQIRQMTNQLGTEMDITYAGRYTFSGFRTDEPPVFERDDSRSFRINQTFAVNDIEITKSYQKLRLSSQTPIDTDPAVVNDTYIIKLPYANAQNVNLNGFTVVVASAQDETVPLTTYNPYDSSSIPAGTAVHIVETGEIVLNPGDAMNFNLNGVDVTYEKTGFAAGELNPIVYFKCEDLSPGGLTYNMDNQDMAYEFSVNTHVNINSLAKNVYTDKMYADLNNLCTLLESVTISDRRQLIEKYTLLGLSGDTLTKTVNNQLADEKARLTDVLHDRFNNMLEMCDRHIAAISKQQTDLGSRMNRLDLILARLDKDEGSYKKLMSDNEDTDMMQAIMFKSNAEAVYQASLKAGASIIQMTLSNFI